MDEDRKKNMNLPESKLPWGQELGEVPLDFRSSFHWRVFRIMGEFVQGFEDLAPITNGVSIFGSARTSRDDPAYAAAQETAALFVRAGFAVITGGGPGIMEAANKGALEAGGTSVGWRLSSRSRTHPPTTKALCPPLSRVSRISLTFGCISMVIVVPPKGIEPPSYP